MRDDHGQENYYASFEDEKSALAAVKILNENNIEIKEIYSPVPLNGSEQYVQKKRTWLPEVGFLGGVTGAVGGFLFQLSIANIYPVQIGGKPLIPYLTFFPVIFECMILGAFIALVAAFFFRTRLGPGSRKKIIHEKASDHQYIVSLASPGSDIPGFRERIKELLIDNRPLKFETVFSGYKSEI